MRGSAWAGGRGRHSSYLPKTAGDQLFQGALVPKRAGTLVRNQPHAKASSQDTLSKSSFSLTFMIVIAFKKNVLMSFLLQPKHGYL